MFSNARCVGMDVEPTRGTVLANGPSRLEAIGQAVNVIGARMETFLKDFVALTTRLVDVEAKQAMIGNPRCAGMAVEPILCTAVANGPSRLEAIDQEVTVVGARMETFL